MPKVSTPPVASWENDTVGSDQWLIRCLTAKGHYRFIVFLSLIASLFLPSLRVAKRGVLGGAVEQRRA